MENSYLISLDLTELNDQVNSTERTYTNLGAAIKGVTGELVVNFNSMIAASKPQTGPVTLPAYDAGIDRIKQAVAAAHRHVEDVKIFVDSLNNGPPTGSVGGDATIKTTESIMDSLSQTIDVGASQRTLDGAEARITMSVMSAAEVAKRHEKRINRLAQFVEKEAEKSKAKIKEIVSNLPAQISTGFVGGIIGSISLGYLEMNRKRAQMGEMANIFEGGVDGVMSAAGKKATRWFSAWGERAQWYWGTGRKEVQAVAKLMVENGYTVQDALSKFDQGLGRVGRNVITLSLGLGKHYNFSTADSMEDIVGLVGDYGMSLNSAADLVVKMSSAGENAAVGVRNFSRIVMSSSDPLARMGVNAETVGVFVEKLLKFYKDMGLDSRYAGREVEGVVVDLISAFSHLDVQLKIAIARDMYGGDASAERLMVQFSDGLRRVSEKGDDAFMENLVRSYVKIAVGRSAPERSRAVMTIQGSLHVANRTAALLYDVGDHLAKGGHLEDMAKETRERLKKAFDVEGAQVSELFKTRRHLVTAMSDIGAGLMSILTTLIAVLILGMKSLKYYFSGTFQGFSLTETFRLVYEANQQVFTGFANGWDAILKGGSDAAGALGKEFGDTFRPLVKVMKMDVWKNYKKPKNVQEVLAGSGPLDITEKQALMEKGTGTDFVKAIQTREMGIDLERERQKKELLRSGSGSEIVRAFQSGKFDEVRSRNKLRTKGTIQSAPQVPSEDLGNAVVQSSVEQNPGLSPPMSAK